MKLAMNILFALVALAACMAPLAQACGGTGDGCDSACRPGRLCSFGHTYNWYTNRCCRDESRDLDRCKAQWSTCTTENVCCGLMVCDRGIDPPEDVNDENSGPEDPVNADNDDVEVDDKDTCQPFSNTVEGRKFDDDENDDDNSSSGDDEDTTDEATIDDDQYDSPDDPVGF